VKLEHIEKLLGTEESEALERKQGFDDGEICKAILAFANDLYERGAGWLILGQAPDKTIVGLRIGGDEAERRISDIARNRCTPAVPVSIETYQRDGKTTVVVEVRKSPARPHFDGKAWVRMGSTTRLATDAEIMLMRVTEENLKIALLKRWLEEGKTTVVFWQLPARGLDFSRSPGAAQAKLLDVNENWVVLDMAGTKRAFPFSEFELAYDYNQNLPQIRYHGGTGG
jgi:hypothetical protein